MLFTFDGVKLKLKLPLYTSALISLDLYIYIYMDKCTFMYASFQVTWISFMSVRFHLVRY